jgi:NADH dehydrogenase
LKSKNLSGKKNIVILGGGFAGVRAALDIYNYLHDHTGLEIILIDRRDYQTYHPGLYEAATTRHSQVAARKVKRTVAIPLADIFAKTKVKVFKAFIERVDFMKQEVITDSRSIPYDYLVSCMGSVPDFYDIPELYKYGFTLTSMEDAIMLRNRVEDLVKNRESGRIVVGGGGFAGVELVGELHNLIWHECQEHGRKLENFPITVVEGGTGFLSSLSTKVSALVQERLTGMMIEPRFSSLITDTAKDHVIINMKERLDYDLLIWTGGVRAAEVETGETLEHDRKGRLAVTEYLNLRKYPNVFIAGDTACYIDPVTKKTSAQTAVEAIRQGEVVAKNISRSVKGKDLLAYHSGSARYLIPVSGKYAIFYTPNLLIAGKLAWLLRKFADLRYFMSVLPWSKAFAYWVFENKVFMEND